MLLLKLAWRNSWRNKRRSIITAATVVTALFFTVLLESLNQGVTDYLIDNEIRLYTAHLEIHREGYLQQRGIGQAMDQISGLETTLLSIPEVVSVSRRLEMLVLASVDSKSKPGILWGIDKHAGDHLLPLMGAPGLLTGKQAVSMGKGMAEELGVSVGDTIVLLGQSYHGRLAADKFLVGHIFHIPIMEMNDHSIMAPVELVGHFADIPRGATSLLITLKDRDRANMVRLDLEQQHEAKGLDLKTWQDVLAGRLSAFRLRKAGAGVIKSILYIILGFGILGSILLTYHERRHECGMMMAMGLKRRKLAAMLMLEMIIITGFGIVAGLLAAFPIVAYFYHNPFRLTGELAMAMQQFNVEPLLMMSNHPSVFLLNTVFVFAMSLALSGMSLGMVLPLKWIRTANQ